MIPLLKKKQLFPLAFILVGIFCAVLLFLQVKTYYPFIADDALISLRYSQRLIRGYGLTWTDGIRVEGYSNILWVLANALLGWLGIDLVLSARILGVASTLAATAAILFPFCRSATFPSLFAAIFSAAAFILAAPTAVWAIGGLEQPLVAAFLAWAVVLSFPLFEKEEADVRQAAAPGILLGLLSITRLDGVLFAVVFSAALLVSHRFRRSAFPAVARLLLPSVLLLGGQVLFRTFYYGEWVPNTALVKVSPSLTHFLDGINYLRQGALALFGLQLSIPLGIACLFFDRTRRKSIALVLAAIFLWASYVVFIGGDIFPAYRQLIPIIVLEAILFGLGLAWAARRGAWKTLLVPAIFLAAWLGIWSALQARDEENQRAITERWEWDGFRVGTGLKALFRKEQPLLAVDPAGCLPFWSELPSIDMLGLNDYFLPRHPPPDFGTGYIGHELGDGAYILNRRPDLVILCRPTGDRSGCFRSGRELVGMAEFHRKYLPVTFQFRELQAIIWVFRESQAIGMRETPSGYWAPAYLLETGGRSLVVQVDSSQRAYYHLEPGDEVSLSGIDLPDGAWKVNLDGGDQEARIEPAMIDQGTTELRITAKAPMDLYGVEFTR